MPDGDAEYLVGKPSCEYRFLTETGEAWLLPRKELCLLKLGGVRVCDLT